MQAMVTCPDVKFLVWCRNTDLCSNLFRERTMIVPRRARGEAGAKRTHWSLYAPRSRSAPLRASNPKNFLTIFLRLLPRPLRRKAKRRKEILACVGGSVFKSSVRSFHFLNSSFSDFPPPEALPPRELVVYLTCAHHTPAPPHSSLTPFALATAVLPCVSLVASFEFVVFKMVCANAQTTLYVLVPPPDTRT